jgi:hypothetical protein
VTNNKIICLLCGLEQEGTLTHCPADGVKLVSLRDELESEHQTPTNEEYRNLEGRFISNCKVIDKLGIDGETVTYSAQHLISGRSNLKIKVRPITDAAGAAEFIQHARQCARVEGLDAATIDLGVATDGYFMFIILDPEATDEVPNPTIEQSMLLAETVRQLIKPQAFEDDLAGN